MALSFAPAAPARRLLITLGSTLTLGACQMPNPAFNGVDEFGDTGEFTGDGDPTTTGDGDPTTAGDGDPTTTTGDGDPTTGDGDAESTTGDGDGDGDLGCDPGLTECNGECVDLLWDQDNCEACNNICPQASLCGYGECVPVLQVFVSSHVFPGGFGGSATANEKCNDLAGAAQLPGTYKAWLSDAEQSPAQSFAHPTAAAYYVPGTGQIIAWSWADLTDGQLSGKIDRNEFGQPIAPSPVVECDLDFAVWTGTNNQGEGVEPYCNNWAIASETFQGVIGNPSSSVAWSQGDCTAACFNPLPVYCVQQPG